MQDKLRLVAMTADSHLRKSQYGYAYRGKDFLNALLRVLDDAKTKGIRDILHGGDLIDLKQPPSGVTDQLLAIEKRLLENDQRMWAVSGNHERDEPTWTEVISRALQFYNPNIIARLQCIDGKRIVLESGISVTGMPACTDDELRAFLRIAEPADVLLWHGTVKEFAGYETHGAIAIKDFVDGPFRSILLGDLHPPKYFSLPSGGIIGYPGSTELCSNSEPLTKSYTSISFPEGQPVGMQLCPIQTRKVLTLQLGNEEAIQRAVDNEITAAASEPALIFVTFDPTLENVYQRLAVKSHPQSIIRASAMDTEFQGMTAKEATGAAELKPVDAFLSLYIPDQLPRLSSLAGTLIANKGVGAKDAIAEYVEARRQEFISIPAV